MDKNIPGTFSSDAEVNDFCNDLITSVRQMKEKKVCRTTVVIPIIETRNKTGLTQEKFAKMLGVSVKTLSAWEQGVRTPSGAARTQITVTSFAPRSFKNSTAASAVLPVASIGSKTKTLVFSRSLGTLQ